MDRPGIGVVTVAGEEEGTGFAVSESLVLTAFHLVRDDPTEEPTSKPILFWLLGSKSIPATVREWDADLDFALLELDESLPAEWEPVAISTGGQGVERAPFRCRGFPRPRPFDEGTVTVHGTVTNPDSHNTRGAPALELYCAEVAVGRNPGGLSGAPVQFWRQLQTSSGLRSGWAALGVVCYSEPTPEGDRLGYGGNVLASSLAAIAEISPTLEALCVKTLPSTARMTMGPVWPVDYPLDFGEELAEAEGFVGREGQLAEIQRFADEHDCGYVYLEASAGLGKSALAAHFATLEQAPAFFADSSRGSVAAAECLTHLGTELVLRRDLDTGLVTSETDLSPRQLGAILRAASEQRSDSVWLVVDGLDEAEPAPYGANPLLLPPRLPDGVFVLVTSRGPAGELFIERPTQRRQIQLSGGDTSEDLERFVKQRVRRDERLQRALAGATPQLEPAEFAREIAAKAEGNFMFVTYLLEDIAEGQLELDGRPEALDDYYEVRFWRPMMQGDAGSAIWNELKRPVLERLAVAAEPVSARWVAAQIGRSANDVTVSVLQPWQRFLRCEPLEGEPRWRVIHRSFSDFLGTKFDVREAHRAVARSGRAAGDGYARRHLAEHLRAAGDFEGLLGLVEDPVWEKAQLGADPSAQLLVHDFEQARLAVGELDAAAAEENGAADQAVALEVWCALAIASVRTRLQAVAPGLVAALVDEGLWTFERARETVRESPDPMHRAMGLLALSHRDPKLLQEALVAGEEIETSLWRRTEVRIELARALPPDQREALLAAMLEEAKEDPHHEGAYAIRRLIAELAEESLPAVLELAEGFTSTIDRCVVLLALAHRLGPAVAESEVARAAVRDEGLPEGLLDVLAIDPSSPEAPIAAEALLESVAAGDESFWRGTHRNSEWVIEALAPRLGASTLRAVVERSSKAHTALTLETEVIAARLADAGDVEGALDAVELGSLSRRHRVLAKLAPDLPDGSIARYRELSEELLSPYDRGEALGVIIGRLPTEERTRLLAEVIPGGRLDDGEEKAEALVGFAPYLPPQRAAEAFEYLTARESATDLARGIAAVAPALPNELLGQARRLAQQIADKYDDRASAAVFERLSGEELIAAAKLAAGEEDLQPLAAVALARRLDPPALEAMLSVMVSPLGRPSATAALALAPYLSVEQVAALQPRLSEADWQRLTDLREVCRSPSEDIDAARLAAPLSAARTAPALVANAVAVLVERRRHSQALALAWELPASIPAVLERMREARQPVSEEQVELALSVGGWEERLSILISLVGELSPESIRRICGRLEEEAVERVSALGEIPTVNAGDRRLALMQYRASLLPLYARLKSADRAPLLAELDSFSDEVRWPGVAAVLAVTNSGAEQMPADIAAVFRAILVRFLADLSKQSRSTALRQLREVVPILIGIGGRQAAAMAGSRILDVYQRWP